MNSRHRWISLKTLALLVFGDLTWHEFKPLEIQQTEVVLAERPVREMQAQLRLHFRTQDPQGWWCWGETPSWTGWTPKRNDVSKRCWSILLVSPFCLNVHLFPDIFSLFLCVEGSILQPHNEVPTSACTASHIEKAANRIALSWWRWDSELRPLW
jgi:hypothetical protein